MPSRARSASWPDAVPVAVLAALIALAWWTLWVWGRSPAGHPFGVLFVAGWTLMTIAMMLPSSLPLVLVFERIVRGWSTAARLVVLLIAGYLAVWAVVGVGLQLFDRSLHRAAALMPWPSPGPWMVAAGLLGIAGTYQFSGLKHACLEKCRSPHAFVIERWRGGNEAAQALRIGASHGLFCVGCCWSLMLLMFVVGVGSVTWMLGLGAVMAIEKNFSWGRRLSLPLGVGLLAAAAVAATAGLRS
jgi:predicted metal-binding membrane protein